jgi:hypothetical protein
MRKERHSSGDISDFQPCHGCGGIAGIRRSRWLKEKQMRSLLSHWTVRHAAGNTKQRFRRKVHIPMFGFDRQASAQHQKEIIGVIMAVSDEFPLNLDHHDVIVIVAGDDFRDPVVGHPGQLVGNIH